MSALKSVIITLPAKGLTAAKATGPANVDVVRAAPKLNFTTSILVDKIKMESAAKKIQPLKHMELGVPVNTDGVIFKQEDNNNNIEHNDHPMRGKKRRLDHLTWEEKLQRKKLKNRVAAQTSRDRKKAKLDELEETVRLLKERNDSLTDECTILRTQNESLLTETRKLKKDKELAETKETTELVCSMCQARVCSTVPALGSAVSPINPLQQGGTVQMARPLTLTPSTTILLKILTLFLLSKTYLANSKGTSISSGSKSLPKAFCEKLPMKWKQILLQKMNRMQLKKKAPRNLTIQKKWWGRHQVMWKPMRLVEA